MELARSARRYDEYWGAAERADTRLKCKDNTIHHVHSQILSCWSPVLRDMITQQPAHSLVESTHGLAYLLAVPEEGAAWAALLDMLYPSCPLPSSWVSPRSSSRWCLCSRRLDSTTVQAAQPSLAGCGLPGDTCFLCANQQCSASGAASHVRGRGSQQCSSAPGVRCRDRCCRLLPPLPPT